MPATQATRVTERPAGETDLYVIGDVNPDILVIDEDVVPEFGQVEKYVGTIRLTVGGSSAITACGAARLGLRVAHGGIVGDDLLGHAILEALRERGVDTSTISIDAAIPTGATVHLGTGAQPGHADRHRHHRPPAGGGRAARHPAPHPPHPRRLHRHPARAAAGPAGTSSAMRGQPA